MWFIVHSVQMWERGENCNIADDEKKGEVEGKKINKISSDDVLVFMQFFPSSLTRSLVNSHCNTGL